MIYLATYIGFNYILYKDKVYIIDNNSIHLIVSFYTGRLSIMQCDSDIIQQIIIFNNKIKNEKRRYIKSVFKSHRSIINIIINMLITKKLIQEL